MSLLWWVFLANGIVLLVALLLLAFSPIEIDAPIQIEQFALLLAGFVVLVGLDLVLLRRVSGAAVQAHGGDELDRPGQAGPSAIGGRSAQR